MTNGTRQTMPGLMCLLALIAICTCACRETFVTRYATFAEAERAGDIPRGWIPSIVPRTATDIVEAHNIDTNDLCGRFSVSEPEMRQLRLSLRELGPPPPGHPRAWCQAIPEWSRFENALMNAGGAKSAAAPNHVEIARAIDGEEELVIGVDEVGGHIYFWSPSP